MWRIYYDGHIVARSEDNAVESVPCDGVVVIAQDDADVGRELLHQKDFYYWESVDKKWYGCDRYGLEDYLRRPGWKKIVAGRNVKHSVYHQLMEQARLDPTMPYKSALQTNELLERQY